VEFKRHYAKTNLTSPEDR